MLFFGCLFFLLPFSLSAHTASPSLQEPADYFEMSFEELMGVRISVASRKEETFAETAAAVSVLTREDIRRSGATSLPEALRLIPGINVARIDGNKWAVSIRGFNQRFANKLLVLLDGRSLYTALSSGVYWDVQDTMLEDVERIEVIRGPGASTWGINAVNGVINIITRSAHDTRGSLLTAAGGNHENGLIAFRHGGSLGKNGAYRVFGKFFDRAANPDAHDAWSIGRGGMRLDWQTSTDRLMIQADAYDGTPDERAMVPVFPPLPATPPFTPSTIVVDDEIDLSGGSVTARWNRSFGQRGDLEVLAYWDTTSRTNVTFGEERDTLDLEFHQRLAFGRHEVVWGAGYRHVRDDVDPSFVFALVPPRRNADFFNAFAQNETTFAGDRLRLIAGAKIDQNDFTGFEIQPTLRLAWLPKPGHTLWAAVSRAVRSGARTPEDNRISFLVLPGLPGGACVPARPEICTLIGRLHGNRDFDAEAVVAVEAGYRFFARERFNLDIALFANAYDDLLSIEPCGVFFEDDPPPAHLVLCSRDGNETVADSHGLELAANLEILPRWQLSFTYSLLELTAEPTAASADRTTAAELEGESPEQTAVLRSMLSLAHNLELDTMVYYVDRLPSRDTDSYVRIDARLGWRLAERWEIALVVQNASDRLHREWGGQSSGTLAAAIERSYYGKVTFRF